MNLGMRCLMLEKRGDRCYGGQDRVRENASGQRKTDSFRTSLPGDQQS